MVGAEGGQGVVVVAGVLRSNFRAARGGGCWISGRGMAAASHVLACGPVAPSSGGGFRAVPTRYQWVPSGVDLGRWGRRWATHLAPSLESRTAHDARGTVPVVPRGVKFPPSPRPHILVLQAFVTLPRMRRMRAWVCSSHARPCPRWSWMRSRMTSRARAPGNSARRRRSETPRWQRDEHRRRNQFLAPREDPGLAPYSGTRDPAPPTQAARAHGRPHRQGPRPSPARESAEALGSHPCLCTRPGWGAWASLVLAAGSALLSTAKQGIATAAQIRHGAHAPPRPLGPIQIPDQDGNPGQCAPACLCLAFQRVCVSPPD